MSLRRYQLHHADPDYLQPPVECPNPRCEGGDEYLSGNVGLGGRTCPVCKGASVIHDEQDIEDAYRWAEARGLRVRESLDALMREDD